MSLTYFAYIMAAAMLLAVIPGAIAKRKGYGFWEWWMVGWLMWIVVLPATLLMGPNPETRRDCPACRKSIDRRDKVCIRCHTSVPAPAPLPPAKVSRPDPEPKPPVDVSGAQVGLFFASVGVMVGVMLLVL